MSHNSPVVGPLPKLSLNLKKREPLKPLMRMLITQCIMVLTDLVVLAELLVAASVLTFEKDQYLEGE